jgi:hypothetical protein
MADCKPLDFQKISGVIYVGGFTFCTPGRLAESDGHLVSFNVNRSISDPTAKLQCQVNAFISSGAGTAFTRVTNNLGDRIVVKAGVGDNLDTLPTLFTGYVVGFKKRNHWNDAQLMTLEFSAEDVLVRLRVQGKFSRRFQQQDEAYAIITGGTRRQGGNMTMLRKIPAGSRGVSFMSAANSGLGGDHSPLVKTPDPQGLSPNGSKFSSSGVAPTAGSQLRSEPSTAYAGPGSTIFWQVLDASTGLPIDVQNAAMTAGRGCCVFMSPKPTSTDTGSQSQAAGVVLGSKTFPATVGLGAESNIGANGFTVKITGASPARLTFVHPTTGATANLELNIIPPHTHRTIADGGPAVGSYDIFSI